MEEKQYITIDEMKKRFILIIDVDCSQVIDGYVLDRERKMALDINYDMPYPEKTRILTIVDNKTEKSYEFENRGFTDEKLIYLAMKKVLDNLDLKLK